MKVIKNFASVSESELPSVAEAIGRHLKPKDWISLEGNLGAGKTTLVRQILRGFGCDDVVASPTYSLLIDYEIDERRVIHIDGFRLDGKTPDPWDFNEWGDAIVFVEWPEKTRLPREKFTHHLRIDPIEGDNDKREITFFSV